MKNILLILSYLLVGFAVFSQETNFVNELIYSYDFATPADSALKGKAVLIYDSVGNLTSRGYYDLDSNSSDWVGCCKAEWVYGENGNLTLHLTYNWNSNSNDWVKLNKSESAHDTNGNLILSTSYYWNSNDWVKRSKYESAYDENGNLILRTYYDWDLNSNDWGKSSKDEYAYDENGNLILLLTYNWNSNDWVKRSKIEYAYDENGNKILYTSYDWDLNSNDWVKSSKDESAYDENGNLILRTFYDWDLNSNDWVGSHKEEYAYDENGNLILFLTYNWNSNDWVKSSKSEYTYDTNGNLVLETLLYYWDSNSNDWLREWKWENTYDTNGNLILYTSYKWDSSSNEFKLSKKNFYYSDIYYFIENESICDGDSILWQGDYLWTEGIYFANYISVTGRDSIYELALSVNPKPSNFSINGQNTVTENQINIYSVPANTEVGYSWFTENGNVISTPSDNSAEIQWGSAGDGTVFGIAENQFGCESDTSKLEVSIGATGINDAHNMEIILYPNPVKHILNIKNTVEDFEIDILDLTGKKILSTMHKIIDVSFLNSGAYIIRIKGKNGLVIDTKRIIKE